MGIYKEIKGSTTKNWCLVNTLAATYPMGDAFLSDFFTKNGKFLAVNVLKETTD